MSRLTLHMTPLHIETIDWIMDGDDRYRPDNRHRRRAVEQLILDYAQEVRERTGGENDAPDVPRPNCDEPAVNRHGLGNAISTITRLRKSRDRYRDLAVRAEAALLGVPTRDDFGGIECRLERALRDHGFEMPARPQPGSADRRGEGKSRTERE